MIVAIYMLKMISCSGLLYAYYYFILRNRSFHQYNRYYLLSTLVLSLLLPLVKIPYLDPSPDVGLPVFNHFNPSTLPEVILTFTKNRHEGITTSSNVMILCYAIIFCYLFFRLLRSFIYFNKLKKKYPCLELDTARVYLTDEPGTPFSFFHSIFWNNNLNISETAGQQVLNHELYHVKEKHSLDILLTECVITVCWFNPFFFLIKTELKAIHEFLADEAATANEDKTQYAELLLVHAISVKQRRLAQPFFHNQIKR